jgi:hypothetical protein
MQSTIEISAHQLAALELMKLAHTSLCERVDNALDHLPFSYTETAVSIQVSPGKRLTAYAVASNEGLRLTIESSEIREAIYLLLDAIEATKAGVFNEIFTGKRDRIYAECDYMSGYPQVLEWA